MIRQATLDDIDHIKKIADSHKKELGFVMRPALVEAVNRQELLYHTAGAFCHYHKRRDGITTVYEICVTPEARGQGIARAMIERLERPIRLKCPVDNSSNQFYSHIGFELIDTVPGKKRELNVWLLS